MPLERAKKAGRKFLAPVPTQVGGAKMFFKVLPKFLMEKSKGEPKHPLGPFRTDAAMLAQAAPGLRVTWFGHSSLLLEIDGARVLIDPVWDERASPAQWFGPKRFFAPTLRLDELPPLDAVLISHDHYDHMGEGTVRTLAGLQPHVRWITSLAVGSDLRRFGVAAECIRELDWTQSAEIAGVTVTSVPARHFSGRSMSNRNETLWASFVLAGREHTVYYGADSGWWQGFAEIGRQYGPFDLVMLEVGAFNELWKDIHLGPEGAVQAFEELGGGLLMPIHWGLFNLALHPWREPIERVFALLPDRLFAPEPGLPTVPGELRSTWWTR